MQSLRARLVVGTAAWLVVAFGLGGLALSSAFRRSVEASFDERLESLALAVVATVETAPGAPLAIVRPIHEQRFERPYSGWYWQVDDGETELRSRSLWDSVLTPQRTALPAAGEIQHLTGPRDEPLRAFVRVVHLPFHHAPVTAVVAGPEQDLREEIARFGQLLFLSLAALGAGLATVIAVQVGYGLRPLRRLALRLEDVRAGRVARLDIAAPREVAALVRAMNDVLDQDAERIERARTHVGNLAHALKTPLAVLAAEVERADFPGRDRLAEQIAEMSRLIDHHLTRAAAAGRPRALGRRTDASAVVRELGTTLERLHAERRLRIDTAVPSDLAFAGERQDLEEMLGNLMDNACKWAASQVRIEAARNGRSLVVAVHDDGPGLSPEAAERARGRGVRLDDAEPGTGLGLAITADLAELYGGVLDLVPSHLGGLCARLVLPAA